MTDDRKQLNTLSVRMGKNNGKKEQRQQRRRRHHRWQQCSQT